MPKSVFLNKDYDVEFEPNGNLKLVDGLDSLENMLKFDLTSNAEWYLREDLGLPYITESGNGILQIKDSVDLLESYLREKILKFDEVIEILEIDITNNIREYTIVITIRTIYGIEVLEVNI